MQTFHSVKLRLFPFSFSSGCSRQGEDNYIQTELRSRAVFGSTSNRELSSLA